MSTLKQQIHQPARSAAETDDAAVAAHLQAHPDFFERHQQLLAALRLPHTPGTAAVSLVERQVSVLRQKNLAVERKLKDLLDVARSNDALASKIHALTLLLLEAVDRIDVVEVMEEQLRLTFGADEAVLVLFEPPVGNYDEVGRFLRVVGREDPQIASFKTFLQSSTPRCGQVRDAQRDFLFGLGNIEIGSVALVPLGAKSELGFLAIGSHDADHFHPGKSIDFLARLGELVSAALRSRR